MRQVRCWTPGRQRASLRPPSASRQGDDASGVATATPPGAAMAGSGALVGTAKDGARIADAEKYGYGGWRGEPSHVPGRRGIDQRQPLIAAGGVCRYPRRAAFPITIARLRDNPRAGPRRRRAGTEIFWTYGSEQIAPCGDGRRRVAFEASGGLRLSDATLVARTGVDYVAVGAITHSAQILDIALDLTTQFANTV